MSKITLDLRGVKYMMPVIKLARAIKDGRKGDIFEVIADYTGIDREIERWCVTTGNVVQGKTLAGGVYTLLVVKGG